jgi:hypothetical protein
MIPNGFNRRPNPAFQKSTRPLPLNVQPVNGNLIIANQRILPHRNVKDLVSEAKRRVDFFEDLTKFLLEPGNFYLTFGGAGDLILLLAEASQDPLAKIIFFANTGSRNFMSQILFAFGIPNIVFDNCMGTPNAKKAYKLISSSQRLMPSQHLNANLDYEDWKNRPDFYARKLIRETNWKERFGVIEEKTNPIVTIAPSGSFKNNSPQKYLHKHELEKIINMYRLYNYTVYLVGSFTDQEFYRLALKPEVYWLSVDNLADSKGKRKPIKAQEFFKIINSSDCCCSVDTWLKTYTSLVGIKTHALMNRYNNVSKYGEMAGDYIFLNTNLWQTMTLNDVTDFINHDCFIGESPSPTSL